MMNVAPRDIHGDYVACSACGATHAKRHKGYRQKASFGLCENCIADFYVQNGNKRVTANDLNGLLASRLHKTLSRKAKGQIVGRCEAVSATNGFQCAQHAQRMVWGRRVCSQHAESKSVRFAVEEPVSKHGTIIGLLRLLSEKDKSFAIAMAEFAKSTGSTA